MNTDTKNNKTDEGFGRKILKGAAWTVLSRLAIRLIGLISTLILARLLVPEDFGLIALAMSFYAILDVMSAFGFDMVLIQNQDAERSHYDTAWTLNVIKGTTSALLMLIFAGSIASFFNEPRVELIIQVLSVGMFVTGFENIGIVAFRKEMQFNKDFRFMVISKLIAFVVTISLAFMFQTYWALIAGMLAGMFMSVFISYQMHPYRPRFSLEKLAEIFSFSKWILLSNVVIYINRQGADIIIGKYNGSASLGLYTVSFEISNLPTTELVYPISRAIFPGYAKLQNDLMKFGEVFLNTLGFIALFAIPMGVGISLLAELMVPVMLGDKWSGAVPLIEILAIYGVSRVLVSNAGSVYLAMGKPHIAAYMIGIQILFQVPFLVWAASNYGVVEAAWVMLVSGMIFYPMHFLVVVRLLPIGLKDIVGVLIRPIVSVLIMSVVLKYLLSIVSFEETFMIAIQLLLMIIIGAIVYMTSLFGMWFVAGKNDGVEKIVLKELMTRWGINPFGLDPIEK